MPPSHGPVLFCGDPHGSFSAIVRAAGELRASAVVLLGDLEPVRPLHVELAAIVDKVWFIHGNHDTDTDAIWHNVWGSTLQDRNVHGRVVALPNGMRLAGLGGVFRGNVWYPNQPGAPAFRDRETHRRATPRVDRWQGTGTLRKHWSSIYPDELDDLSELRADVLVTHEAPGYHPLGFPILDTLAQALGVRFSVHGHQHDALDSSDRWASQGFKTFGVGKRGITAIDADGEACLIVPGDIDDDRRHRQTRIQESP